MLSEAAKAAQEGVRDDAAATKDAAPIQAESPAVPEPAVAEAKPSPKAKASPKAAKVGPKEQKKSNPKPPARAKKREKAGDEHFKVLPVARASDEAMRENRPVDCKRIFVVPISAIESYENPRTEPEHLYRLGYTLFGNPDIEEPKPEKGQFVSLIHLALSDNMQKVRHFVELVEKHESVDRSANQTAPQSILELATDLETFGQMLPVLVKKTGKKHGHPVFDLAEGGRRVAALLYLHAKSRVQIEDKAEGAPKKVVPPTVQASDLDCSEDELFRRSVIVNFSRKGFTELQQGWVCHQMLKRINPETIKGGSLYDRKKHPQGRHYYQKEAAAALNMTLGTFRYREALWHPYNSKKKTGLTDDDRRKISEGRMNVSYAAKRSLGEPVSGTGQRKKTKHRPLNLKQMQELFDKTTASNRERRQAIADCMGLPLQQAIKESRTRLEEQMERSERQQERPRNRNRRRKAA